MLSRVLTSMLVLAVGGCAGGSASPTSAVQERWCQLAERCGVALASGCSEERPDFQCEGNEPSRACLRALELAACDGPYEVPWPEACWETCATNPTCPVVHTEPDPDNDREPVPLALGVYALNAASPIDRFAVSVRPGGVVDVYLEHDPLPIEVRVWSDGEPRSVGASAYVPNAGAEPIELELEVGVADPLALQACTREYRISTDAW